MTRTIGTQHDRGDPLTLDRRELLAGGFLAAGAAFGLAATRHLPRLDLSTAARSPATLRFGSTTASPSDVLDPSVQLTNFEIIAVGMLFDSLLQLDNNFVPHPGILTSWKANSTATEWTLQVRKGVHFHDGSALTAQDVAYSIARNVQPNGQSPVVGLLGPYLSPKNITTPGAYTVKLQLHAPYGFLPLELGNRYMRVIKSGTTSFTKAIGTGPYKLKSFVPGQTLAVTRNASYWRTPPLLQGIVSENIPSSASLVEALLVGNVDAIESVDFSQVSQIRGSHGHKLIVLPDQYIPSIDFDVLVKPYNDPRVLEAIKLSVNRPQLINTVYQGLATVGYDVPVPSSDPYFGNLPKPEYNPQKAKQLLAAAGYASGLDVKLIVSPVGPSMVEFGEAIAAQLAAAGINMSIQTWPTGTFWNQVWLKAPACTPIYLRRPANEILTYIGSPHGAFNGTHWSNRTFDKELTAALRTASPGRQRADFRVAESIESKSGGNLMPVFAAELAASSTRVQVAPSRVQLLDFS